MFITISLLLFGYLLGSINSAIIVCKLLGLADPRKVGSGNPGATNMLRIAGKKIAFLVLMLDFLKGLIPVLLAKYCSANLITASYILLSAMLGHMYPIFFKFKGGKGIATGFGALTALSPIVTMMSLITWLTILAIFRISGLAAIITNILIPIYSYFYLPKSALIPISIAVIISLWRHRSNILRLLTSR